MRLSPAFVPLAVAAVVAAAAVKRQFPGQPLTILSPGSIQAPVNGTVVTAGDSFPLSISVPEYGHCHPLYTPVDIYLLADKPTTSSLNSTYQFPKYLHYYGGYVTTNIAGAYPPPSGSPPPSSLITPKLGSSYNGQKIYVATVETIFGCPPTGYTEYAIDSVGVVYNE